MSKSADHDPRRPTGAPTTAPAAGPIGTDQWDQPWETYHSEEVRPYAITGGRTRPQHSMRLVTLLEAADSPPVRGLAPEAVRAVELCRAQPCPVAEIAARLSLPVQAAKVVLSDLIDCGALVMAVPRHPAASDRLQVLEALRSGLETKLSHVA
ncbi:DUF742 domain-containing protein [Actinomadura bangladeshensis]|uniref:DUF742 domain-containing protein n=1 Tax=Actinomadura bangladeshensis TaxID=453573 RepID=A0A4R4NJQ3_9ACTN|nr:DUF742 domain-containing protein [Actinomadura bangladeshensis]TDC07172.1 DUF742 domain-containing protein [Actinomadura bangladeshensis]